MMAGRIVKRLLKDAHDIARHRSTTTTEARSHGEKQPLFLVFSVSRCLRGGFSFRRRYTLELPKQPLRISVIDLLQHLIWQPQPVNHPPPLRWILRVREVLVFGFEPSEIVVIHLFRSAFVGAKHDAVGIFQEQPPHSPRLPSQFSFARSSLNHYI